MWHQYDAIVNLVAVRLNLRSVRVWHWFLSADPRKRRRLRARLSCVLNTASVTRPRTLITVLKWWDHKLIEVYLVDYILLKTQMGDENRWQIELLQRFSVYTFFRELVRGSELILSLTLWRCIRRNVGEVLFVICSRHPFVSLIKYNLKHEGAL